jgi:hypothetical protein
MTKLNNADAFYDWLRSDSMLGPSLDPKEFEGLQAITNVCSAANWPISWAAYALATAYHETAHTMQPIAEYGGPKYFTRMYDLLGERPVLAKKMGNTTKGDGIKYRGRGYVQLTWKSNYSKAATVTGEDLVGNPDLAMQDDIAAKIMVSGMSEGWFTGKSCKNSLPTTGAASKDQFIQARRIINGLDKADTIANYAIKFQKALSIGEWK